MGNIILSDELKNNVENLTPDLKTKSGIKKNILLTGDKKSVAINIANELKFDELYSELLPQNKVEIVSILSVIAILGVYNNVMMIKDNYSSTNSEPMDYMKENIQEGDTIVFANLGGGFVAAIHFVDNQVYFYNADNWGVEEAYKAFGPNYETCVTKDFIEDCSERVWVIDVPNGSVYEDLFGDKDYNKVSEEEFFTKYHDYSYKITLIEK